MSLRSWLRKAPQPTSLRIVDVDGNVRDIMVTPGRNCWKNAEQAILGARAVNVEALDPTMKIIRSQAVEYEDDPDDPSPASPDAYATKEQAAIDKALAKDRREMAGIIDRYGDRLCEAFTAGAAASNNSHETLVGLVETLTMNLSAAITNVHNISAAYARLLQDGGKEEKDPNDDALAAVIGGALERFAGGGSKPPSSSTTNGANGKKKP